MRKIISVLLSVILMSGTTAAAFADGFNASIDVVNSGEFITVIIPDENEGILNRMIPSITIPCNYDFAKAVWEGSPVADVKADGSAVSFPLEHAGTYTISRESLTAEAADLVLPSGLTEVGSQAFQGVNARSVYIPDGCQIIGAEAFEASEVKYIRIPESAVEIDPTAFPAGTVIYGAAGGIISAFADSNGFVFISE